MEIHRLREHDVAVNDDNKEDQEPESRSCKKKKSEKDDLYPRLPMELALGIRGAVGIDDVDPVVTAGRCYCVLYWIEPDKVFHTRPVQPSRNNPVWEELDFLPVLDYAPENWGFLHVEVARLCSDTDPGPSSGSVIVGRARVPLPKIPYCTIEDRFGLVKHIGEGHMCLAGDIILCMKLQRAWPFQRPDYMINDQQLENSDSAWF